MTWAPDELLQAESAIRQAATDHRVQLARRWPLPDLTSADAGYREAITHATRALTFTNERRDAARDASAEALTLAAQSVDHSTSLAVPSALGAVRGRAGSPRGATSEYGSYVRSTPGVGRPRARPRGPRS